MIGKYPAQSPEILAQLRQDLAKTGQLGSHINAK
jgi:hypothetical protein